MRRIAAALASVAALALALAPSAAQAWSWGSGTSGDGNKVTEPRQVADFTSVRLVGSLDAAVKVGRRPRRSASPSTRTCSRWSPPR